MNAWAQPFCEPSRKTTKTLALSGYEKFFALHSLNVFVAAKAANLLSVVASAPLCHQGQSANCPNNFDVTFGAGRCDIQRRPAQVGKRRVQDVFRSHAASK